VNDLASPAARAAHVRESLPAGGLFDGHEWRVSPVPFSLGEDLAGELETLGRVLLQFYRALNLLYRRSVDGSEPAWISQWLDQGKSPELIALQRDPAFKNEVPRVIRPDVLLTEEGFAISELDSVPGGIGLTQWLNATYADLGEPVLGGRDGMKSGFESIHGDAPAVHLVVSEESASYRPEMAWLAHQLGPRFQVRDTRFEQFGPGDSVYRFFELFDLPNVANSARIFELARQKSIRLTPPPKPIFEEKAAFALLWNRNLREFWRKELGEGFLGRLMKVVPRTWLIDPAPLPPQAAYPGLELTDWRQLKSLSQRERDLILKISGYSEDAWGARGVYLGSDLNLPDWSAAVDKALAAPPRSTYVLQRYHKPRKVDSTWFNFGTQSVVSMPGRVRLCPYYFVAGVGDAARPTLGGVLATICPADKKIIHGMTDAILAPCIV
jgi:hypothetical protein